MRSVLPRKLLTLVSLSSLLAAQGCLPDAALDDSDGEPAWIAQAIGAAPEHDERSVLVKFRTSPTRAVLQDVLGQVSGAIEDKNTDRRDDRFAHIAGGRLAQIELRGSMRAEQALARLQAHPAIEYAEPNYILYASATPNDPSLGDLWGLHNSGQSGGTVGADISAVDAWSTTTGSSDVIVGVIDTGIDYTHADLSANMWVNPGEIPGNGIDDDGNGYADDVHGINAITNSGDPMDDNDHGTHVAGTIGAAGNNGVGVVGVNWNVTMVGMKFLSSGGSGTTADAIKCVDYAVALKNSGVNIRVLSNSWGGGGFSQSLLDAIAAADAADIMFVAAAGNSSSDNDISPHYPSSYEVANVVAVASTDRYDAMSSFSSYGATSVDLGAPGSAILSTAPGDTYQTLSGTSMATPHVSGVAALLLSYNSALTTAELKSILMGSGDSITALSGKTVSGKRLNAANALAMAPAPMPSFGLSVAPGSQTINQGQSTSFAVDVSSLLGFVDPVTLSWSSTPTLNAAVSFTANLVTPGSSSNMDIATTTSTATGDYTITVTGSAGDIVKTRTIALEVRPEGTTTTTYSSTTPVTIPDSDATGITSTITVLDSTTIAELSVAVNITHSYIGDLKVLLTSPAGTTVTLHSRSGGSTDNLYRTYAPAEFTGENAYGEWTLAVQDHANGDLGTLDAWSLTVIGVPGGTPGNIAPAASFTWAASNLDATFTDASTDSDGTITGWSWNFGDGFTSTAQSPNHTYAAAGSYTVSLTVTDDAGGTGIDTQTITIVAPSFDLAASPAMHSIDQGRSVSYSVAVTPSNGFTADVDVSWSASPALDATVSLTPNPVAAGSSSTMTIATTTATATGDYTITVTGVSGAITKSTTLGLTVLPEGTRIVTYDNTTAVSLPDNDPAGITSTIDVLDALTMSELEVSVNISHTYIGDLVVTLTSPAGTTVTLHNRSGGSDDNLQRTYLPLDFNGESSQGVWTLAVQDLAPYDLGTLESWSLAITGTTTTSEPPPPPPAAIELSLVKASKKRGEYVVDIDWTGATTANVVVYRDGVAIDTTANDGGYRDRFSSSKKTFVYQVCEDSDAVCSNEVTVSF